MTKSESSHTTIRVSRETYKGINGLRALAINYAQHNVDSDVVLSIMVKCVNQDKFIEETKKLVK